MLVIGVYECSGCGKKFSLTFEKGEPQVCPSCKSGNITCIKEDYIKTDDSDND